MAEQTSWPLGLEPPAGLSWMVHGVGRRGRVGGPEGCRCSLHRISGWCKVVRRRCLWSLRCCCAWAGHHLNLGLEPWLPGFLWRRLHCRHGVQSWKCVLGVRDPMELHAGRPADRPVNRRKARSRGRCFFFAFALFGCPGPIGRRRRLRAMTAVTCRHGHQRCG